jgi:hypothetical protein
MARARRTGPPDRSLVPQPNAHTRRQGHVDRAPRPRQPPHRTREAPKELQPPPRRHNRSISAASYQPEPSFFTPHAWLSGVRPAAKRSSEPERTPNVAIVATDVEGSSSRVIGVANCRRLGIDTRKPERSHRCRTASAAATASAVCFTNTTPLPRRRRGWLIPEPWSRCSRSRSTIQRSASQRVPTLGRRTATPALCQIRRDVVNARAHDAP